jgi:hypothetical protein
MILSLIATLISSIALVGVAIGLILQARQLRTSQLQATRSLHAELIRIGMENPSIGTAVEADVDPEEAPKAAYLNLLFMFLQTSYLLRALPRESLSFQTERIFSSEYSRAWWAVARNAYKTEMATKREKAFLSLVDAKYEEVLQRIQSTESQADGDAV